MRRRHSELLKISLLSKALRGRFDARARTIGVTRAQWLTIAAVRRREGATQRQIAEMLDVGDVTIGRLIDKVCEQGWVERRPDPADRRAHRVFLTPKAMPVLEKLDLLADDEERRALAGLTEAEVAQFSALLDHVLANLADPCEANAGGSDEALSAPQVA